MSFWNRAKQKFNQLTGGTPGSSGGGGGCEHSQVPHQPGTPEFEMFIAKEEFRTGRDLPHGARHLAHLISLDPKRADSLELLSRYLDRVGGDETKLYPRKEQNYFAEEAVRAWVWARNGQIQEALDLIVQVVNAKPDSTYLEDWALGWVTTPEALAAVSENTVLQLLAMGNPRGHISTIDI